MKFIIAMIMVLFMAVGCASREDVQISEQFYGAHNMHVVEQTTQVATKSVAIQETMEVVCEKDSSGDVNAYCVALAMIMKKDAAEAIAGIKADEFNQDRPMNGNEAIVDGLIETGNTLTKIAPSITMGIVVSKAIEKDKGSVSNYADNGATVNNSYEESHATNVGSDNIANNNQPGAGSSEEDGVEYHPDFPDAEVDENGNCVLARECFTVVDGEWDGICPSGFTKAEDGNCV